MVRAAGSAEHPRRLTPCPTNCGGAAGQGLFLCPSWGWTDEAFSACCRRNERLRFEHAISVSPTLLPHRQPPDVLRLALLSAAAPYRAFGCAKHHCSPF